MSLSELYLQADGFCHYHELQTSLSSSFDTPNRNDRVDIPLLNRHTFRKSFDITMNTSPSSDSRLSC